MRLPAIRGVIDRRILVNYRLDPDALRRLLAAPFRPQLVGGAAMGGVCLIRLARLRPGFLPLPLGLGFESAAHRFAVEWDDGGETQRGVYVPRRDTDSLLAAWAGGRVFPGVHHRSQFTCKETNERVSVAVRSRDASLDMAIQGVVSEAFPGDSVFDSLDAASAFFEGGSLGYSPSKAPDAYEGLELRCRDWRMDVLDVETAHSSFFDDARTFPAGTAELDCALLMRGIRHSWHARGVLRAGG